ncbi:MAG: ABC transporter permease [Candidatus Longimicrobiales bacterium M2_2A_002]
MLLKLAWRNLWRHRTRTLIMGSAVAFAYGLMLAGFGIADDGHRRMLREGVEAAGGDVLVHGDGYWASRASDIIIDDGDRVLATVRGVPGVQAAFPRVLINGLVSTSADSRPVMLQGIDPGLEAELHDYPEDLVAGSYFGDDREDPLVLGSRLVENLELEIGDRVVLTASGPDGEMTRALFHLTGVVESGLREMDEVLGLTTIAAARDALGDPDMLTQIGVLTGDDVDHREVAERIRTDVSADGNGLEVLTWEEAIPEMVGLIEIDDAFGYIYYVVIFAVVLFSITNTFLMAVMERVREFGLLNALGLRNERIGRLLLTETALLTALAMGVGFLLGYSGHLAADHWGIPISMYGVEEMEMSGVDMSDLVMHSTINPMKWALASALVAIATVGAAIYPAWRASKLAPAEAMRFYE